MKCLRRMDPKKQLVIYVFGYYFDLGFKYSMMNALTFLESSYYELM